MRTDLEIEDLGNLLEEPLVAVLATLRDDGSVLLSPVWPRVASGRVPCVGRGAGREGEAPAPRSEGEHRGRRISAPPARDRVRGSAQLIEHGAFEAAVAIASRYIGEERAAAYVASAGGDPVIARIAPGDLRAWDFADEYEAMRP